MTAAILSVVSGALVLGALWGVSGRASSRATGFIVAVSGGALIVAAVSELIEPAAAQAPLWQVLAAVAAGAAAFTAADWVTDRWMRGAGIGMLIALTFDGVPENVALGLVLSGAGPLEAAALTGSILLANLPEAAGGARRMREAGQPATRIVLLWSGVALILLAAGLAGNALVGHADGSMPGLIRAFAAGAVISSLATEVVPEAYNEYRTFTGVGVTLGAGLAFWLHQIGGAPGG